MMENISNTERIARTINPDMGIAHGGCSSNCGHNCQCGENCGCGKICNCHAKLNDGVMNMEHFDKDSVESDLRVVGMEESLSLPSLEEALSSSSLSEGLPTDEQAMQAVRSVEEQIRPMMEQENMTDNDSKVSMEEIKVNAILVTVDKLKKKLKRDLTQEELKNVCADIHNHPGDVINFNKYLYKQNDHKKFGNKQPVFADGTTPVLRNETDIRKQDTSVTGYDEMPPFAPLS